MVDDQVVRDADHPGEEPSVVPVFAAAKRLDHFDECFLEQIFRKLLVFDGQQDICIDLAAVPVDKGLDG